MRREEKISKEEYKRIVTKGRRWLMDYLTEIAEGCFSDETIERHLLFVIGDMYKQRMKTDEDFFWCVYDFVSERRLLKDKKRFLRGIMSELVADRKVVKEYAKRYPDEYLM